MQIALIIIGILIFISFASAIFDQVLNFGNIAGMAMGAVYVASGFLINEFGDFIQKIIALIAALILMLIVLKMREIYAAGKTSNENKNVIIVLGCRVKGNDPSLALVKRADAAYKFLLRNSDCVAILSGGQGKDENLSEALCMQKLLIDRGIPKQRLILEDRSTSTDENIRFSLEIMDRLGMKREAAIVTSEYHQKRALRICERYGLKAVPVSSKTKWTLLPTFLFRECFGLIKESILKRI